MQAAQPIKPGEVYNNFSIVKALKSLDAEAEKIENEVIEIWGKVRTISAEAILEDIKGNLEKALSTEKPLLYLSEPKRRIWIEVNRELVKKEYLEDVKRLLPPILAYFKDDLIIAYIPGTELKIHEVIIWDLSKKPKLACSCDNYRLIGNIRTIGTCAHVRIVLYWLSGSLQRFYERKYSSIDEKDISFVSKKEEELERLLEVIKKSINEGKLEKIEGGALWRIGMPNVFIGIFMSNENMKKYLEEIYKLKEWLKAKREYFRELEKELSANLFKSKNIQWR